MNTIAAVAVTTFLASAVEAIEMVAILGRRGGDPRLAGGARRRCRGGVVLLILIAALGVALTRIPIGPLRLVVGALLLVFGLNWLRKGVRRVAAHGFQGFRGMAAGSVDEDVPRDRPDWTGFVLSFKGVCLEGLEVAFIAVTFGTTSNQLGASIAAALAAVAVIGALGAAIQPAIRRIPRSVLQLAVGLLLTTFGTFWAVEGLGVAWPGSDVAIPALLIWYALIAGVAMAMLRGRHAVPHQAVVRP